MLRLFVASCARSVASKNSLRRPQTFVPALRLMSSEPPEHSEPQEPTIPPYIEKFEEPLEEKRRRLQYQVNIFFFDSELRARSLF